MEESRPSLSFIISPKGLVLFWTALTESARLSLFHDVSRSVSLSVLNFFHDGSKVESLSIVQALSLIAIGVSLDVSATLEKLSIKFRRVEFWPVKFRQCKIAYFDKFRLGLSIAWYGHSCLRHKNFVIIPARNTAFYILPSLGLDKLSCNARK